MRTVLAILIIAALLIPVAHTFDHKAEPKKEVLFVISKPLNELYKEGYHYVIYRMNETLYDRGYKVNFRLASSVELTPAIAANYSAAIVFLPNIKSRYSGNITLDSLLTFLELSDRGMLLIGNTDDVNQFLYRFGRVMSDKAENVSISNVFGEPIFKQNYTFFLNETATMKREKTNYTTTPPRRYPKDYDTFEIMQTNTSKPIAIAAETVDNTRFIAFTAVEAITDDSNVQRGGFIRDMLDRILGDSYHKISVKSRGIEKPEMLKVGDVIKARVNINATPGDPEVYLEVYRGTVMSYKGEMKAENATYYEGSRTAEIGQSDIVIVIHVRGYGYRTSEPVHVVVYPNRKPIPIDPVLASLFLLSFLATLAGLIIIRREIEYE